MLEWAASRTEGSNDAYAAIVDAILGRFTYTMRLQSTKHALLLATIMSDLAENGISEVIVEKIEQYQDLLREHTNTDTLMLELRTQVVMDNIEIPEDFRSSLDQHFPEEEEELDDALGLAYANRREELIEVHDAFKKKSKKPFNAFVQKHNPKKVVEECLQALRQARQRQQQSFLSQLAKQISSGKFTIEQIQTGKLAAVSSSSSSSSSVNRTPNRLNAAAPSVETPSTSRSTKFSLSHLRGTAVEILDIPLPVIQRLEKGIDSSVTKKKKSNVSAETVAEEVLQLRAAAKKLSSKVQDPLQDVLVRSSAVAVTLNSPQKTKRPPPSAATVTETPPKRRRMNERHSSATEVQWSQESDSNGQPSPTAHRILSAVNSRKPSPLRLASPAATSKSTKAKSPAPVSSSSKTSTVRTVGGSRRDRKFWSDEEVNNLREGVKRFGVGRWKDILQTYSFETRTAVDLKDKWRNLGK
eukprot:GILJ01007579.1.p1 GENE.GILJ01007579.1~~GILJ01007579.1.p1  ORF type:complete len:507 (+),score=107.94 GILJ01007579.1:112-1521(+)